jgi:hypothetical protein
VPLPDTAVAELEALVRALRKDPLPMLLLSPAHFALTACAEVMAAVGRKLRHGVGLAVIDRVPVERFSVDETARCTGCWADSSADWSRRNGTAR